MSDLLTCHYHRVYNTIGWVGTSGLLPPFLISNSLIIRVPSRDTRGTLGHNISLHSFLIRMPANRKQSSTARATRSRTVASNADEQPNPPAPARTTQVAPVLGKRKNPPSKKPAAKGQKTTPAVSQDQEGVSKEAFTDAITGLQLQMQEQMAQQMAQQQQMQQQMATLANIASERTGGGEESSEDGSSSSEDDAPPPPPKRKCSHKSKQKEPT